MGMEKAWFACDKEREKKNEMMIDRDVKLLLVGEKFK